MQEKYFYIIVYIFFVIGLSIVIEWVCNKENFVNTNSLDAILETVLKEKKEQIKKEFLEKLKGYTVDEYTNFLFKPKSDEKLDVNVSNLQGYENYTNIQDFKKINTIKDPDFMKKISQMKIPKLMY